MDILGVISIIGLTLMFIILMVIYLVFNEKKKIMTKEIMTKEIMTYEDLAEVFDLDREQKT